MMGLIIAIHVIACILLIILILIQAGRGGGLVEGFSGVESMFGTKTNTFLPRSTSVLSTLFIITCISLALLSARKSRSLMRSAKPQPTAQEPAPVPAAAQTQPPAAPEATPQPEPQKTETPKAQDSQTK